MTPQQRLTVRNERSRPLIAELQTWLRTQCGKLSRKSETAKAIDYSLKRWPALTRFLADGRLCISNNAAERALRDIAVGRHNWIDPQAWLADVLACLSDHPMRRVGELLPWQWCGSRRPHHAGVRRRNRRLLAQKRTEANLDAVHARPIVSSAPIRKQGWSQRSVPVARAGQARSSRNAAATPAEERRGPSVFITDAYTASCRRQVYQPR
jgi:transposase